MNIFIKKLEYFRVISKELDIKQLFLIKYKMDRTEPEFLQKENFHAKNKRARRIQMSNGSSILFW
jgi:hypothetical protein